MTPRRLIAQWRDGRPRPSPSDLHGMGILQAALCGGPRLHGLRKDSGFDYALKGRASYQGMPSGIPQIAKKQKTRVETGLSPSLICSLPAAENVFPRLTPPLNRGKRLRGKEVGHGNSRLVPMPRC